MSLEYEINCQAEQSNCVIFIVLLLVTQLSSFSKAQKIEIRDQFLTDEFGERVSLSVYNSTLHIVCISDFPTQLQFYRDRNDSLELLASSSANSTTLDYSMQLVTDTLTAIVLCYGQHSSKGTIKSDPMGKMYFEILCSDQSSHCRPEQCWEGQKSMMERMTASDNGAAEFKGFTTCLLYRRDWRSELSFFKCTKRATRCIPSLEQLNSSNSLDRICSREQVFYNYCEFMQKRLEFVGNWTEHPGPYQLTDSQLAQNDNSCAHIFDGGYFIHQCFSDGHSFSEQLQCHRRLTMLEYVRIDPTDRQRFGYTRSGLYFLVWKDAKCALVDMHHNRHSLNLSKTVEGERIDAIQLVHHFAPGVFKLKLSCRSELHNFKPLTDALNLFNSFVEAQVTIVFDDFVMLLPPAQQQPSAQQKSLTLTCEVQSSWSVEQMELIVHGRQPIRNKINNVKSIRMRLNATIIDSATPIAVECIAKVVIKSCTFNFYHSRMLRQTRKITILPFAQLRARLAMEDSSDEEEEHDDSHKTELNLSTTCSGVRDRKSWTLARRLLSPRMWWLWLAVSCSALLILCMMIIGCVAMKQLKMQGGIK